MSMEENLRNYVYQFVDEVGYLKQLEAYEKSQVQKEYYRDRINTITNEFIDDLGEFYAQGTSVEGNDKVLRDITHEELAQYDGKNGQPAYVAVEGTVYDVSNIAGWAGGAHFGLTAGRELTREFTQCHQGFTGFLRIAPKVGRIVE